MHRKLVLIFHFGGLFSLLAILVMGIHSILVLALALLTFLLAFGVAALLDHLLLIPVQVFVLVEGVLAQVSHIDIDFCLVGTHVVVDLAQEKLKRPHEVSILFPNENLLGLELLLDMLDELLEVALIV